MFAVVKTGGKQYKVTPGDVLLVEKLQGEAGENITLSDVLLVSDEKGATVGSPLLEKAEVKATIREQARNDKIIVFKKKRRQGYRRTAGHRQDITVLTINDIVMSGKSVAKTETGKPVKKVEAKTVTATAEEKPAKATPKATVKKAAPKAVDAEKKAAPKKAPAKKAAPKATEKKAPAKSTATSKKTDS